MDTEQLVKVYVFIGFIFMLIVDVTVNLWQACCRSDTPETDWEPADQEHPE